MTEHGTAPAVPAGGVHDAIVIGAGQSGLAAAFHLKDRGIEHLVLDAESGPGGAWQHRWPALTMQDVHGVADLPGSAAPPRTAEPARDAIPAYFGRYEREHGLAVIRPVAVTRVQDDADDPTLLRVCARRADGTVERLRTRHLVSATGTWRHPFVPYVPGITGFEGRQLHTATFHDADELAGQRVIVVGAGASAVQFLGMLAPVADVLWATRRPPQWRQGGIDGLAAVTEVERLAVQGRRVPSVVSVTGLVLREQEEQARRMGVYDRRLPMFTRIDPDGVTWDDGRHERVDTILWATGFRPAVGYLAPLHLRSAEGGIALERAGRSGRNVQGATTAAADHRVHLVGYGPSASTIGAGHAARQAALAISRDLAARPAT